MNDNSKKKVIEILKNNGVVIIPTDTIYGFSCILTSESAREKIRSIKKRDNKPFIILESSLVRIKSYFSKEVHSLIELLCKEHIWPGKFTLIAPKSLSIPDSLVSGYDTVAVRYPNNNFLKDIINSLGVGILSTSINYSGDEVITTMDNIPQEFISKVDFIYQDYGFNNNKSSLICLFSPIKRDLICLRSFSEQEKQSLSEFALKYNYNLTIKE